MSVRLINAQDRKNAKRFSGNYFVGEKERERILMHCEGRLRVRPGVNNNVGGMQMELKRRGDI